MVALLHERRKTTTRMSVLRREKGDRLANNLTSGVNTRLEGPAAKSTTQVALKLVLPRSRGGAGRLGLPNLRAAGAGQVLLEIEKL